MRLVTRSDFDGLGCAAVLREAGIIDKDILFVHPKDVQDGKVEVNENDVMANIPYVEGCGMWFDHHSSEDERLNIKNFKGKSDSSAKSAARVIYDYYGGREKFQNEHLDDLVKAVDKADSADFTREEILNPTGWPLISFVMDPRTGLGRYRDYRISNYALMEDMIDYCRTMKANEILELSDVKERTARYFEQNEKFKEMLLNNSKVDGNLVILDLRNQEEIFTGNRFLLYSLFPDQNVSLQIIWGLKKQNVVFTCGYSILKKDATADIGSLMLKFGGGGHKKVGTCQVPIEKADQVLKEIVDSLRA
ncbi:exopolyphosphatase [Desulfonatronovibrio magnus]|uniref:exopolyphosphatase n=1 Tax=Desulfonatronovibrio magnus TaxID=698827 RepID=UPI0005EB3274|nr:exopolyphosphatase [Desulfonatronovibrio magnus]